MIDGSSPSDAGAAPVTEAAASTEIQDVNSSPTASSGDDKGASAPKSILEAVQAGIKNDKAAGESPTSNPETNVPDRAAADAEAPLSDRPDSAEMNSLHSRTRRRVKQLLGKWDEAKAESDSLKPLAEQFRKIDSFVQSSGLNWDEVNSGFNIMRLMKNDPFAAREALVPMMIALNKACGVDLPPELQQKVDQGFVDEDTARRTAQAEARARLASQAHTRTVEQVQERQQAEAHQRHVGTVTTAVKDFQKQWQGTDPDYAAKAPLVMEKVELTLSRLARQGQTISDPAQAVKIVEDAKKAVEATFKPFMRKEAIDPLPSGTVSVTAGAKPKSMVEAITQGLALRV
jgi:hypothetical protein